MTDRLNPWAYQIRYAFGLDDVVLKPGSQSQAWQKKRHFVTNLDRIAAATGRCELALVRIARASGGRTTRDD